MSGSPNWAGGGRPSGSGPPPKTETCATASIGAFEMHLNAPRAASRSNCPRWRTSTLLQLAAGLMVLVARAATAIQRTVAQDRPARPLALPLRQIAG